MEKCFNGKYDGLEKGIITKKINPPPGD